MLILALILIKYGQLFAKQSGHTGDKAGFIEINHNSQRVGINRDINQYDIKK